MNRQIKFRWVGRNLHFNEIWIQSNLTTDKIRKGEVLSFFNISNSNCEFLSEDLFTGLKDKNGVEIYESDIFTFDYLKELDNIIKLIGSFVWNDDELRYEIDIYNNEEYVCLSYIGNGIMRNYQVIGNIYENSDLLND